MAVSPVIHPSAEVLQAFALGKTDDSTASVVMDHLDDCPDCCRRVAALSSDDFLDRLRQAHGRSSTPAPAKSLDDVARAAQPPANQSPVPDLPLELVNNPQYEILRELGRGGMGVVYLAKNKLMDRLEVLKVVNKTLLDRPGAVERFLREIRSAAKLSHTNIVGAYSAVQSGDLLAFAMEYVEGEDLAKLVKSQGPLPVAHACYYVQQAALGLQHAHDKKMVHRDIKPQNLILAREGKKHLVKILDFGLAKATREKAEDTGLTGEGAMLGTPDYVAPEQTLDAAKADIRADIYSLGCTLYYLLSGSPPFKGRSLYEILQAHHSIEAQPLNLARPEAPEELAAVVRKMMAKDPAKRYQSPAEVVQALGKFIKPASKSPPAKPALETSVGTEAKTARSIPPPLPPPVAANPAPARPEAKSGSADSSTEGNIISLEPRKSYSTRKLPAPAVKRSAAGKWLLGGGIGVGVLLLALLGMWAGGVFRVKTPDGFLVVEVNEPNPDVLVDGEQVTLTWDNGGKTAEIRVKPGTHRVEVRKDGFTVSGEDVSVGSEGRTVFTASIRQVADAKSAETFTNSLGMEFVRVPKGKAWLGGGGGRFGTKEIEVAQDFYLGKYEVTQEEWRKTMGRNPSHFSRAGGGKSAVKNIPDADLMRFPVEFVSWDDVQMFVKLLNAQAKEAGWLYRLPKEEEWEYACRGGPMKDRFDSAFDFYFQQPVNQLQPNLANYRHPRLLNRTSKTGSYQPNRLGLHDMHGNVWEWCEDLFNPSDPKLASHRVVRGGSWAAGWPPDGTPYCKALSRHPLLPNYRNWDIGLRVARVPIGKEVPPAQAESKAQLQSKTEKREPRKLFKVNRMLNGKWILGEDYLEQTSFDENAWLGFGDPDWKDYDFAVEVMRGEGVEQQVCQVFRCKRGQGMFLYGVGWANNTLFTIEKQRPGKIDLFGRHQGHVAQGKWYKMLVRIRGKHMQCFFDGAKIFDFESNEHPSGCVALRTWRTRYRFRNIKVTAPDGTVLLEGLPDLNHELAEEKQVAPTAADDGFVPLFNGKDTTGWKTHSSQPGNWRVENGLLIGSGTKISHLFSERGDYEDFHLRVQARINDGGNSGVCFRTPSEPTIPATNPRFLSGYEAQINCTHRDLHKTGSLYAVAPVVSERTSPVLPGEWFTLEVIARGNRIAIKVNDKTTVDTIDEKRHSMRGHIALQQYDPQTVVEFRRIEIKELSTPKSTPSLLPPEAGEMAKAYAKSCSDARARLIADFDKVLEQLAKQRGPAEVKLQLINAVKEEKKRFEESRLVPWSEPMQLPLGRYFKSLADAQERLRRSYNSLIDKLIRAQELRVAEELREDIKKVADVHVLARWKHIVQGKGVVHTFYSNGKIDNLEGKAEWNFDSGILRMSWPHAQTPGGFIVDTCRISIDGTKYAGSNQSGKVRILGEYVNDR